MGSGVLYCAPTTAIGWWAARLSLTATAFAPPVLLLFASTTARHSPLFRPWVWVSVALAALLTTSIWNGPGVIDGLHAHPWGPHIRFGSGGALFALHIGFFYSVCLALLTLVKRRIVAAGGTADRVRGLRLAMAWASLGFVDFLPAFGIPVYPAGFVPVYMSLLLLAQVIWQHGFPDVSARLAADRIVESMPCAVLVFDTDGWIWVANPLAETLFGSRGPSLVGRSLNSVLGGIFEPSAWDRLRSEGTVSDLTLTSRDGRRLCQASITGVRDSKGRMAAYVCAALDITEHRNAQRALEASETRFRRLLDANLIGYMGLDADGLIVEANDAFLQLVGYARRDLEAGRLMHPLLTPPEYRVLDRWMEDRLAAEVTCPPVEKELMHRDGSRVPVLIGMVRLEGSPVRRVAFVLDASEKRRAMTALQKAYNDIELRVNQRTAELARTNAELAKEIVQRKEAEAALHALLITDSLTGLHNRRGFFALAEQLLAQARRLQRAFCLFFIDMDGLKQINDTHGHPEGDRAIQATGGILKSAFRASDVLARLGGDEFAVATIDDGENGSLDAIPRRLQQELQVYNDSSRLPYRLSFSIGMIQADPADDTSLEALLQRADQLLYDDKRTKKSAHVI